MQRWGNFWKEAETCRLPKVPETLHIQVERQGYPHAGTCTLMHMGDEASLMLVRASFEKRKQGEEQFWWKITPVLI